MRGQGTGPPGGADDPGSVQHAGHRAAGAESTCSTSLPCAPMKRWDSKLEGVRRASTRVGEQRWDTGIMGLRVTSGRPAPASMACHPRRVEARRAPANSLISDAESPLDQTPRQAAASASGFDADLRLRVRRCRSAVPPPRSPRPTRAQVLAVTARHELHAHRDRPFAPGMRAMATDRLASHERHADLRHLRAPDARKLRRRPGQAGPGRAARPTPASTGYSAKNSSHCRVSVARRVSSAEYLASPCRRRSRCPASARSPSPRARPRPWRRSHRPATCGSAVGGLLQRRIASSVSTRQPASPRRRAASCSALTTAGSVSRPSG